jgi:phospho-N-acetylmuramoyl-pentapeptide-transferase
MTAFDIMRIFVPATISFLFGIGMAPLVTHYLYAYKMWKPQAGKIGLDGLPATIRNQLHAHKDVGTPIFGGILVWGSVGLTALLLQILWIFFPDAFEQLAFISRNQTWLPLAAMLIGAVIGFFDDLFVVRGSTGIKLRYRLMMVAIVATLSACWFYAKLDVSAISLPFGAGLFDLGPWFIPFFVLVALFIYAGGVIDGLDGLAGGVFAIIFGAYAGVAFFQDQLDLAALCAAISGGLLAFLWFNIPPARFYLSETGTMGLTLALVVVAFLTDGIGGGGGLVALPIIALPLVVTVFSVIAQIISKKVFKRKLFRVAPLHHHFEALGWPSYKVVMRYWVVGFVAAIVGMAVALL